MKKQDVLKNASAIPLTSPSYSLEQSRFINREFLIITYRTEIEALKKVVPKPLEIKDPLVKFEFIRMPDSSSGFGSYTEAGQVIPVQFKGKNGNFVHSMYLDSVPPISGGREIWGFPKKYAKPSLRVEKDTLIGFLYYGSVLVATATMGYKFKEVDRKKVLKSLHEPQYLLKIIPDVDTKLKICQLVSYHMQKIKLHGVWTGPCALELFHHALAPVADLPIKEIISAIHFVSDLSLSKGKVVFDYMKIKNKKSQKK